MIGYLSAVVIGLSLGLLGGGGSILTVPALIYLMDFGMKEAVPASLIVVGLTSLVGVVRHQRAQNVDFRAAFAFGPLAIVGAYGGAILALRVSAALQLTIFAVVMLAASLSMLLGPLLWGQRLTEPVGRPRSFVAMVLLGGTVGILTGLVGVGGGFLYVPALTLVGGVGMRKAVGTSLVLIVLSCAAGVAKYLGAVILPWETIAGFTFLAFVGVMLGSALVPRVSQTRLRQAFALFLLLMGSFVLWQGEGRGQSATLPSSTPETVLTP